MKYNRTMRSHARDFRTQGGDSMTRRFGLRVPLALLALCLTGLAAWYASSFFVDRPEEPDGGPGPEGKVRPVAAPSKAELLEQRFASHVQPFVERYCVSCH